MAISVAARVVLLAVRPLWHDEIFTIWVARLSPSGLVSALSRDSGPPLFYLLEKPFVALAEAFGQDRLVRALPFVAALAVLFALRYLRRGSAAGWLLVLTAASPFLLLYAGEARAYALLAALNLGVFLLLFCGRATPLRLAGGAALAAAALWTHYLAGFFLAVAGLLLLATRRWRAAAAVAAGGIAFLPWLPVVRSQPAGAIAWLHETAGRSTAMFLAALGGSARVPLPVGVSLPEALLDGAAVVGAVLLVAVAIGARGDPARRDAVILTTGTLLLLLLVSIARPVAIGGRSEMAVLPIWLFAVASGCAVRGRTRVVAGAAVLLGIATCVLSLAAPRLEPGPSRVADRLPGVVRPEDRAIASTAFYLPLRLAADRGRLAARLLAFPPDLAVHPGWFLTDVPPAAAYDGLAAELARVPPGARAFLVMHPLWVGPELARATAAGTVHDLLREGDAVLLEWLPPRSANAGGASGVAARDGEQGESHARR